MLPRPDWAKGYSRRGAAEHALGRFVAAQTSYRKALELDPENASFIAGLAAGREGEAKATVLRIAEEKRLEKEEEERKRRQVAQEAADRLEAENREALGDFFSTLDNDEVERKRKKKSETGPHAGASSVLLNLESVEPDHTCVSRKRIDPSRDLEER